MADERFPERSIAHSPEQSAKRRKLLEELLRETVALLQLEATARASGVLHQPR